MKYKNILFIAIISFLGGNILADQNQRACSVREMNEVRHSEEKGSILSTTGTIQKVGQYQRCVIEDKTGRTLITIPAQISRVKTGDRIAVTCIKTISPEPDYDRRLNARKVKILGKGEITSPLSLRLDEIDERKHDLYDIATQGNVVDILSDEIDSRYHILLLKDGPCFLPIFTATDPANAKFLGARIGVVGNYSRLVSGLRRFSGPYMIANRENIKVISPRIDPFKAPALNAGNYLTPKEVAAMDQRTLEGTVLALWNQDHVMLQTGKLYANVQLKRTDRLPSIGSRIKVSGYPEVDLYKINLTKADWIEISPACAQSLRSEKPVNLNTVSRITNKRSRDGRIDYSYHGLLVKTEGTVCSTPNLYGANRRILINSDGEQVYVDLSSCPELIPDLPIGCRIEVVGRCLMEVSAWRAYKIFPQILGLTILTRSGGDVKILKKPSWWTSRRLVYVISALVAVLIVVIIWNRLLSRLVERRGRELFNADIARASEALRVQERTRLAVELHDSFSQNLTGIALQIKAGRYDLAEKTLKSCREELRNCLWDLRNNAIDCDGMDEAILRMIAPQTEDIQSAIRFNIPRKALSDNTAYAILRIIRELVTNAVQHGQAKNIFIAGSLETDRLLFSVRDNGCGFDHSRPPGIAEGHFGLQGVKERIAALGGEIRISSKIKYGTKITVTIPLSKQYT